MMGTLAVFVIQILQITLVTLQMVALRDTVMEGGAPWKVLSQPC